MYKNPEYDKVVSDFIGKSVDEQIRSMMGLNANMSTGGNSHTMTPKDIAKAYELIKMDKVERFLKDKCGGLSRDQVIAACKKIYPEKFI